jgi:rhamnosyltransferase
MKAEVSAQHSLEERVAAERVAAVIVSYRPDIKTFFDLLDSLRGQVEVSIIVDNGSGEEFERMVVARAEPTEVFISLSRNMGIGEAQNVGVARARSLAATQVIFFDHDSRPDAGMVHTLQASLAWLVGQGRKVASIGPSYVDERQMGAAVFVRVRGVSLSRCHEPELGSAVSVDHLIASGCLVPVPVLDDIGLMRADLFVDYVDIEWGLRAKSKGYENFGCFDALMHHSLGDAPIKVMGKAYPARSPLRHYYTFRNAVLVSRLSYVPINWKWANGINIALKFVFYALFAQHRLSQVKMMSLGLLHGLRGRTGALYAET